MFILFAFFSVLVLLFQRVSGEQKLDLVLFDDKIGGDLAVCNDGTRGGYYFAKAVDPTQADVYVVHLRGGGQCYDKQSCDDREPRYKSNKYFDESILADGLLDNDPEKTPLWGANKVELAYCSSDGYMGDAPASETTWGYHFRGQRLVHSLFQALIRDHNFSNARMVYLTGSSAGARGLMVHVDQLVQQYIPAQARDNVIAYLDSPYYLDVTPYSPAFAGFQYQEQQKYAYYNTTAILSEECLAMYPEEQWKCQYGQFRMPFVRTPYFLVTSQYDSYQLEGNTQVQPAQYTRATKTYAERFAATERTHLDELALVLAESGANSTNATEPSPSVRHRGGYGIYSWACYNHAVANSPRFYTVATSEGVTQQDAFEAYLAANPTVRAANGNGGSEDTRNGSWSMVWMDTCRTFACGTHCQGPTIRSDNDRRIV